MGNVWKLFTSNEIEYRANVWKIFDYNEIEDMGNTWKSFTSNEIGGKGNLHYPEKPDYEIWEKFIQNNPRKYKIKEIFTIWCANEKENSQLSSVLIKTLKQQKDINEHRQYNQSAIKIQFAFP